MVRRMPILPVLVFFAIILISGLLVYIVQQQVAANAQVAISMPTATDAPSPTPTRLLPSATPQPVANAAFWFPETIVQPDATATATVSPEVTATHTPEPTALPGATLESTVVSTSFEPGEANFMHNVVVALNANNGALRRVVVPPGETFSFVRTLGSDPVHLPWRNVFVQYGNRLEDHSVTPGPAVASNTDAGIYYAARFPISTRVPGEAPDPASPDTPLVPIEPPLLQPTLSIVPVPSVYVEPVPDTSHSDVPPSPTPVPPPSATPEPEKTRAPVFVPVLGGGVCDLASRYVIATRPLLPDTAYRFKLHPNGLQGIAYRDAVSIWFEGRATDLDLQITNTTDKWLVLTADIVEGVVTISAALYSGPPTGADQTTLRSPYLAVPKIDAQPTPTPTPPA